MKVEVEIPMKYIRIIMLMPLLFWGCKDDPEPNPCDDIREWYETKRVTEAARAFEADKTNTLKCEDYAKAYKAWSDRVDQCLTLNFDNDIFVNIVREDASVLPFSCQAQPNNKAELQAMIREAISAQGNNADLNYINTSLITDMSNLFLYDDDFNGNISKWDVSAVTDMRGMFYGAPSFNQDIGGWNVGAVRNMSYMFSGASSFNQDIGGWNVAAVEDMRSMFYNAAAFNQDLSGWDVRSLRYLRSMFYGSGMESKRRFWPVRLNTPNNKTELQAMIREAIRIQGNNADLNFINTSLITNMSFLFTDYSFPRFNGNISKWDVSAVTDMSFMFSGATAFNQDIGDWKVTAVTDMSYMFHKADAFDQDIGGWNVGAVEDMNRMFYEADDFNQDIGGWNVGAVTDMSFMFSGATAFNQDLSGWDVRNVSSWTLIFFDSGMESKRRFRPAKFR